MISGDLNAQADRLEANGHYLGGLLSYGRRWTADGDRLLLFCANQGLFL